MRTLTTQESNLATLGNKAVCIKLEVDRSGSGDYQDLTDFGGYDWVRDISYTGSVDDPVASMDVSLASEIGEYKLSPLVEDSLLNQFGGGFTPALALQRRIKLYAATVPHMMLPVAGDWRLVFDGYIDVIEPVAGNDTLVVQARDQGAVPQDLFIETSQVYGADTAPYEAAEDVLQDILDDNLGAGAITLYTPSSPSWNIVRYSQTREPVMDALRKLASQIGWDLRYKWRAGTAQFELTFYEPDRTKSTPDKTLNASSILSYQRMGMETAPIRNAVRVVYTPIATDARTSVLVTDATSISDYGRRYMEVAEASTSNIDTSTEANAMADGILDDLKDPSIDASVVIPYAYEIEFGDLVRFTADDDRFSTDLDLAVSGVAHSLGGGMPTTTLQVRGQPTGGFLRWLRMEARGGVAPIGGIDRPGTATSGAVVQTPMGLEVTYDDPTVNMPLKEWSHSECHISTSSGFTPTIATLYAQGRTTTFTIAGLKPKTTYYIKIIVVDKWDNRSLASSQQVETQNQVMAGTLNTGYDAINLVRNGEFVQWDPGVDRDDLPPSSWVTASGSPLVDDPDNSSGFWGSGAEFFHNSSYVRSGDRAIRIDADASSGIKSLRNGDFFPLVESRAYEVQTTVMIPVASSNAIVTAAIGAYDSSYALLSTPVGTLATTRDGNWHTVRAAGTTPANTRWGRLVLYAYNESTASKYAYVDSVFARSLPDGFEVHTTNISLSTGTIINSWAALVSGDDHGNVVGNQTFTVKDAGQYRIAASGYTTAIGATYTWYLELLLNGSTIIARSPLVVSTGIRCDASVTLDSYALVNGDYVEVRIAHSSGGSKYFHGLLWTAERLR